MRSIEESLQILDKMPAFQKKFEIFKQGIISAAQAGLTYRGNPVQINKIICKLIYLFFLIII